MNQSKKGLKSYQKSLFHKTMTKFWEIKDENKYLKKKRPKQILIKWHRNANIFYSNKWKTYFGNFLWNLFKEIKTRTLISLINYKTFSLSVFDNHLSLQEGTLTFNYTSICTFISPWNPRRMNTKISRFHANHWTASGRTKLAREIFSFFLSFFFLFKNLIP